VGPLYQDKLLAPVASTIATRILYAVASASPPLPSRPFFPRPSQAPSTHNLDLAYKNHYFFQQLLNAENHALIGKEKED
jgi:hypothetical protein